MKSIFQLNRIALLTIVAGSIILSSCEKDKSEIQKNDPIIPSNDTIRIVAISNEGSYGSGNASLSIYYPDGDSIKNDVFQIINNRPLGDVFQSVGFANDNAFLVINSSNKIEVVNKQTFREVTTISNLGSPRYFASVSNSKAYVTLWGSGGKVGVIDLATNTLTKQITVGKGPERLISLNGKVFVANSGGWGTDNTVSVLNTETDEVSSTIIVGDNPKDFVLDKNGMVWILCSGNIEYDNNYNISSQTSSQLIMINPNTNVIEKSLDLGTTYHPSQLEINYSKDSLYYGGDFGIAGIFVVAITATEKASTPLIDEYFYGFNVDPKNGIIYGLQAPTFTLAGTLKRYNSKGEMIETYAVGIGPNGAYFAD